MNLYLPFGNRFIVRYG